MSVSNASPSVYEGPILVKLASAVPPSRGVDHFGEDHGLADREQRDTGELDVLDAEWNADDEPMNASDFPSLLEQECL